MTAAYYPLLMILLCALLLSGGVFYSMDHDPGRDKRLRDQRISQLERELGIGEYEEAVGTTYAGHREEALEIITRWHKYDDRPLPFLARQEMQRALYEGDTQRILLAEIIMSFTDGPRRLGPRA